MLRGVVEALCRCDEVCVALAHAGVLAAQFGDVP